MTTCEMYIKSLDVEIPFLGGVLREGSKALAPVLSTYAVTPEFFVLPDHKKIFKRILELYETRQPIDLFSVQRGISAESETFSYLTELFELSCLSTNIPWYAEQLVEDYARRKIATLPREINSLVGSEITVSSILQKIKEEAAKINEIKNESQIEDAQSITGEYLKSIEDGKVQDAVLNLGFGVKLTSENLAILAARPSMGKSAFGINLALNCIKRGRSVLFFTLEMSKNEITNRILAIQTGIPINKIQEGDFKDREWERSYNALDGIPKNFLIDDSPKLGILQVEGRSKEAINKLHAQHYPRLGLIIIDYLQLMQTKEQESKNYQIEEVVKGLKILAKELKIPIILLSQLNRAVEQRQNKKPMLSDLRDSGSIEQIADVVLFLHREEYYSPGDKVVEGSCDIIRAKNRQGSIGVYTVSFEKTTNKFTEGYQ